jgi:hypothetical protein
MQLVALILAVVGFWLWVGAYLNVDHCLNPSQLAFATTLFGGREEASMVSGLFGGTLFVLGLLGVFGYVTM